MATTETKPAETTADIRAAAIKAWHDADTVEKKKAAVKQYPILANIYALAATL